MSQTIEKRKTNQDPAKYRRLGIFISYDSKEREKGILGRTDAFFKL